MLPFLEGADGVVGKFEKTSERYADLTNRPVRFASTPPWKGGECYHTGHQDNSGVFLEKDGTFAQ